MDYFLAVIAGLVQGLTEFLPVSSSAHLLILHDFFDFHLTDNLTFDVILHLGTLLALLTFFYRDILVLAKAFFLSLVKPDFKTNTNQRLAWFLIIGSIPAVLAGLLFDDLIDFYFHQGDSAIMISAIMLIAVAVLFLVAEKYSRTERSLEQITLKTSIICGLAQAVALIPGTSRSGITIIAGLSQKLKRAEAARFSFLLSMPIVAGATAKQIVSSFGGAIDWPLLLCGLAASSIVGYFVLKFLLNYLSSHSLNIFAYYRIFLAMVLLAWLIVR